MKRTLALLAALVLGAYSASATITTAYIEGGTLTNGAQGLAATGLVGFNFTVNTDISVVSLGFFGDSLGGGDHPWSALYDTTTSTLLASTTFSPANGWSYNSITPVTLTPGDTYQVSATAWWAPQYADASGFTFGPEINSVGFTTPAGWSGWGSPAMATKSTTSTPQVEANLQYTTVPEPSVLASIVTGAIGLVLFRRRRA